VAEGVMMHQDADVPTTSPLMDRRNFLVAATASLLCAPAIVRASSLMPIKVVGWTPLTLPSKEIWERGERPLAGWAERVGYQMMEHVLKTGWTPERAASFYGGVPERKMRSMVAYARQHGFLWRSA
jgi:hypothetical protein